MQRGAFKVGFQPIVDNLGVADTQMALSCPVSASCFPRNLASKRRILDRPAGSRTRNRASFTHPLAGGLFVTRPADGRDFGWRWLSRPATPLFCHVTEGHVRPYKRGDIVLTHSGKSGKAFAETEH